ncbi:putative ribonuclease H-like domain-containing protein [Tanacetum coccineum]
MTTSYSELGFVGAIYEGKTHQDLHTCLFACFLSQEEPKRVSKALSDPAWVEAMAKELSVFKLQNEWSVDLLKGHRLLYKMCLQNKIDERGIVIRNKARLCCPRTYSRRGWMSKVLSICQIEEIRCMYFHLQGLKTLPILINFTKCESTIWTIKQAPRAWYDTLATYLLINYFQRGQIWIKLFSQKSTRHILLVQYLCSMIFIFGSTKKELVKEFEKLMKDKFQMSSMGELTFFLGLQVQQRKKGIFISQDKYVHEILKKFNYTDVKSASTPTDLEKPLVKDADADDVDEHLYRSMIGSLMYLTASRPDIMFAVCACARCLYQIVTRLELPLDRKSTKPTTGADLLTKGFDAG